jgi:hypothetical protein
MNVSKKQKYRYLARGYLVVGRDIIDGAVWRCARDPIFFEGLEQCTLHSQHRDDLPGLYSAEIGRDFFLERDEAERELVAREGIERELARAIQRRERFEKRVDAARRRQIVQIADLTERLRKTMP